MNDKIVTVSSTNNVVKYYIGRMYIYVHIYNIYIYSVSLIGFVNSL